MGLLKVFSFLTVVILLAVSSVTKAEQLSEQDTRLGYANNFLDNVDKSKVIGGTIQLKNEAILSIYDKFNSDLIAEFEDDKIYALCTKEEDDSCSEVSIVWEYEKVWERTTNLYDKTYEKYKNGPKYEIAGQFQLNAENIEIFKNNLRQYYLDFIKLREVRRLDAKGEDPDSFSHAQKDKEWAEKVANNLVDFLLDKKSVGKTKKRVFRKAIPIISAALKL